jgi:hypothetical protein
MPAITTYRTTDTLSASAGQDAIAQHLIEFLPDLRNVHFLDIIEIQTIGGRIYFHLSDAIARADMPPEYYGLEKASL